MFKNIIVKFAELSLKGGNKKKFIDQLIVNIKYALREYDLEVILNYDYVMINLSNEDNLDKVIEILKNTPGISNIYPALKSSLDIDIITKSILDIISKYNIKDFKIDAKRYDKNYKYNSSEFKKIIGNELPNKIKSLTNLINPKNIIVIFVYKDNCYICLNKHISIKGLPTGTSGKSIVLISGGIDSPVASYLLIKKGLELEYIHFITPPKTSPQSIEKVKRIIKELNKYTNKPQILHIVDFSKIQFEIMCSVKESYRIIIMRRFFYALASQLAKENKISTLGTGESLGQVASQTIPSLLSTEDAARDVLFLRPLIGLNKEEIIKIAREINTYDISVEPFPDCCELFVPKSPTTNPIIKMARYYQGKVVVEELSKYLLENTESIIIE